MKDVSSSQGEPVIDVAERGQLVVPLNPLDVSAEEIERSEEGERAASPKHVRNETVCFAGKYFVRSFVSSRDVGKNGNCLPIPRASAAVVELIEAEE